MRKMSQLLHDLLHTAKSSNSETNEINALELTKKKLSGVTKEEKLTKAAPVAILSPHEDSNQRYCGGEEEQEQELSSLSETWLSSWPSSTKSNDATNSMIFGREEQETSYTLDSFEESVMQSTSAHYYELSSTSSSLCKNCHSIENSLVGSSLHVSTKLDLDITDCYKTLFAGPVPQPYFS